MSGDEGAQKGQYVKAEVQVYSTLGCKYCRTAKAKLAELGVPYVSVDVGDEQALGLL
ncbi:hypothetical protein B484DRAFT_406899, partial [Ochromonadaceae sp. CCMP2298]